MIGYCTKTLLSVLGGASEPGPLRDEEVCEREWLWMEREPFRPWEGREEELDRAEPATDW